MISLMGKLRQEGLQPHSHGGTGLPRAHRVPMIRPQHHVTSRPPDTPTYGYSSCLFKLIFLIIPKEITTARSGSEDLMELTLLGHPAIRQNIFPTMPSAASN